jgi:hypothetical protein
MNPSFEQTNNSQRLLEELVRKIPVERIVETLVDCMHATTVLKNGVVVADWRSRLEAVKLVLAYLVGLPIARQEIVSVKKVDSNSELDFEERMASSPALLASVKAMVARAEALKMAIDAEVIPRRSSPGLANSGMKQPPSPQRLSSLSVPPPNSLMDGSEEIRAGA